MEIPDALKTAVITAGALELAKQGQDFIAAVAGRPGESLGTIVGDWSRRRFQNVEAVGNKAHLILLNIGVTEREVPLNILQPLLEAASIQEDPVLQDTWANLLARAADSRQKYGIEPSFPDTLKDLSSREVKFLNSLFLQASDTNLRLGLDGLKNTYVVMGLRRNPAPPSIPHIQIQEVFDGDDTREFFFDDGYLG